MLLVLLSSCAPSQSFNSNLDRIVEPYRFSIVRWEIQAITHELYEFLFGGIRVSPDDSLIVVEYFEVMEGIGSEVNRIAAIISGTVDGDPEIHLANLAALEARRDSLSAAAEAVLEAQIRETLNSLGIYNPLDGAFNFTSTFPPVKLRLQEPPKLLVVSPRDRIGRLATITLNNTIGLQEIIELEEAVSELDVSALVVDLGGIATYPSFVSNRYGLRFALSTAVEEWFHQYLFFRPLGFRYGLSEAGFSQPDYIATMNETLAGMVSAEIAAVVYERYYASYYAPVQASVREITSHVFNFNAFMRETRLEVDNLLALGQTEQAETYMEERRLILAEHGYLIRKLNQAYFAFYGSYADQPGFENPVAENFKTLRANSVSLATFIKMASSLTTPDELVQAVK